MEINRREFIETAGVLSAIAAVGATLPSFGQTGQDNLFLNKTEHVLPKLPYSFDALEGYIDSRTIELHYTKHHQAYIYGLNKAEAEITEALGKKEFGMIDYWLKKAAFHGAGHYLHSLYWNSMSPQGGGEPKGNLADRINIDFGSFEKFKSMFTASASSVEGSGWALMAFRPATKKITVLQVENHQKLTTWDIVPLMVIDVWEHAYYLKYQNKRADYINAWWNVVNWDSVEINFAMHFPIESKE